MMMQFTSKFHQIIDTDLQRALNFLSSFPNRVQLREVFYWKNREYLNRVHYEKARTNLHAQWAATIWKKGEGIFSTWQVCSKTIVPSLYFQPSNRNAMQ